MVAVFRRGTLNFAWLVSVNMAASYHRPQGPVEMNDMASVPKALRLAHGRLRVDDRRLYIRAETEEVRLCCVAHHEGGRLGRGDRVMRMC